MQSKNALSNLANRYKAVLKKCHLLNTFGTLALAAFLAMPSVANAALTIVNTQPSDGSILFLPTQPGQSEPNKFIVGYGAMGIEGISLTNFAIMNITNNDDIPAAGLAIWQDPSIFTNTESSWSIVNHGIINVKNTFDRTAASGILSEASGTQNLSNSSAITVEGLSDVYGMYARNIISHSNSTITMNNSGTISTDGILSYGMYAIGNNAILKNSLDMPQAIATDITPQNIVINSDINLTNQNSITSTADQRAYGMYAISSSPRVNSLGLEEIDESIPTNIVTNSVINLTNQGTITATSTSANGDAFGMYARVSNPGDWDSLDLGALAVAPIDESTINFNNTGTINATSNGNYTYARAVGMNAVSANAAHFVNNGVINVTSNAGPAYGIYAEDIASGTINNLGIINAKSTSGNAFEVFLQDSHLKVDKYAITLQRDAAGKEKIIFSIQGDSSLDFSASTLYLRPSSEYTFNDTTYLFNDFIVSFDSNSLKNLSQASFASEVPFLDPIVQKQGDNTFVGLSLYSSKLPGNEASAASVGQSLSTAQSISTAVADALGGLYLSNVRSNTALNSDAQSGMPAGSDMMMPESKWNVFFNPYLSYTDNSEYDFDGTSYGLTAGATYSFSDAFALGFHFDVNSLTSESDNTKTDSQSFAFGLHANYFLYDAWYLSALASYAFTSNDADYSISADTANDEYSSNAFFASLNTGYIFEINQSNSLRAETGLMYVSSNTDSYDYNFAHLSMYNMAIDSTDFNALYATFNVNWQGEFVKNDNYFRPSLGVGLRQNLTGSDIDTATEFFGTRYETVASSDDTTITANAGLEWQRNAFSIALSYNGEYGSQQQNHKGSLLFQYEF